MKFKKKIVAVLMCAVVGIMSCLPVLAAEDEGYELQSSQQCPKCGLYQFKGGGDTRVITRIEEVTCDHCNCTNCKDQKVWYKYKEVYTCTACCYSLDFYSPEQVDVWCMCDCCEQCPSN